MNITQRKSFAEYFGGKTEYLENKRRKKYVSWDKIWDNLWVNEADYFAYLEENFPGHGFHKVHQYFCDTALERLTVLQIIGILLVDEEKENWVREWEEDTGREEEMRERHNALVKNSYALAPEDKVPEYEGGWRRSIEWADSPFEIPSEKTFDDIVDDAIEAALETGEAIDYRFLLYKILIEPILLVSGKKQ